jgi:hypothetical protein
MRCWPAWWSCWPPGGSDVGHVPSPLQDFQLVTGNLQSVSGRRRSGSVDAVTHSAGPVRGDCTRCGRGRPRPGTLARGERRDATDHRALMNDEQCATTDAAGTVGAIEDLRLPVSNSQFRALDFIHSDRGQSRPTAAPLRQACLNLPGPLSAARPLRPRDRSRAAIGLHSPISNEQLARFNPHLRGSC